MIINTSKVELPNRIEKAGQYIFKIEKFEEDGFTQNGDPKFKFEFKGVQSGTQEPMYTHTEMFNIGENSLWRIKELEIALKAPSIYEVQDFVGRYVNVVIEPRTYVKNGQTKTAYGVKSWSYNKKNDTLTPIPEAKQDANDDTAESIPTIEIDDSVIPF